MGRKSIICGVGMSDADYAVYPASRSDRLVCPFYNRWKGMITRCYSGRPKDLLRYEGCTVAQEWLSFMVFRGWMVDQPWQGNHLDKDILRPWEKRYCPETSVFIPAWINTLLNDMSCARGALPLGVTLTTRGRRFTAQIRTASSKRVGLGLFDTAEEAHKAWRLAKADVIAGAVERYRIADCHDERVSAALMKKAADLVAD